jgi:hypothetical protein
MDPVFRAPMRARASDAPPGTGAEHGLAHGIVGIGDTAEARIGRFGGVPEGAFVWTRDTDGGRNFQRTHGDAVERRTAELWRP